MAATVAAINTPAYLGNGEVVQRAKVDFDSSYVADGYDLDTLILAAIPVASGYYTVSVTSYTAEGYVPQWDQANTKLKLFEAGADAAALDEVTAATDVSAVDALIEVKGKAA